MKVRNKDIFMIMESLAPLRLAESWDNCGLQVGSFDQAVNGIIVALDLDWEVLKMAIDHNANLIVTHHPLIFSGMKKISQETYHGKLIHEIIHRNITVYSAHTNLDSAPGGLNDALACCLHLEEVISLGSPRAEKLFKLVVFVPEAHLEIVREAIGRAGAGHLGKYSDCCFLSPGTGLFRPSEGANPFLGRQGTLERVSEYRLETIVPEGTLSTVIAAMLEAHPYEEVAYDLYPLANSGPVISYGRKGLLFNTITLQELAANVKNTFQLQHIRYCGDPNQQVKNIGIVSGSGASMIPLAIKDGCDVLITGDIKYHEAQEACRSGLALIDAGHDGLEKTMVDLVGDYLQGVIDSNGWNAPIYRAKAEILLRAF
ncbi:MAG: Nif3-like dinuclear metal center hexameric protein [Chitinophagales bacterium]